MGRGAKPSKATGKGKQPLAPKLPKSDGSRIPDLEKRLAESLEQLQTRDRELAEALEQQTATSDILRVIGSSPSDLQPVFDIIAKRATALTDAVYSAVYLVEGESIHLRAYYSNDIPNIRQFAAAFPMPITSQTLIAETLRTGTLANIADMEDVTVPEAGRTLARTLGVRSTLTVPMRREGHPIGAIGVNRRSPGDFTPAEIALLQTFADQAVIAIENVRLFTELQEKNQALTQAHGQVTEALEQQTATSEILRVISSSPTDVQPVFDAIVRSAQALSGANTCVVYLLHGETLSVAAAEGVSPENETAWRHQFPRVASPDMVVGRAIRERRAVHAHDLEKDPSYRTAPGRLIGVRTVLAVPIQRNEQPIGAIVVWRTVVKPFTEKQIGLLKTFADQAVIAIENVRLFKELEARNRDLTTALDQQTATAEILRVISSSPTDVRPMFEAIAESAAGLCEAFDVSIFRVDGDRLAFVAHHGPIAQRHGDFSLPLVRGTVGGRSVLESRTVQVADLQNDDGEFPDAVDNARRFGFRTILSVPLLRDGVAIGGIALRRSEVRLFTDQQIAVLQTFADQAVIAIENVRLFTELEEKNRALTHAHAQVTESLEQQTATSEILRVISQSPTDAQPVFETIAKNVLRLCEATFSAVFRYDGEVIHLAALRNVTPEGAAAIRDMYPMPPGRGGAAARSILSRSIAHIADVLQDPEYAHRSVAEAAEFRSILSVPMLREGQPIGAITVAGPAARPFPDKQIELLQTFADQAVIAIENVRLFTELQASNRDLTTALDKQTATSDILRVISRSQTDIQPVFDTIIASAVRLLGAHTCGLTRVTGDQLELVALTSIDAAADAPVRTAFPQSLQTVGAHPQAIRDRVPLNVADAHTDARLAEGERVFAGIRGFRSWVVVPMLRDDVTIGSIGVTRPEAGGFTADEITLLQTFADQAVIAIENVRLFTELEARNRDLSESLEQQTATSEILRVISSSPTDVRPVFSAVARSAARLCEAQYAGVALVEEGSLVIPADLDDYGVPAEQEQFLKQLGRIPISPDLAVGRAVVEGTVQHIEDVLADGSPGQVAEQIQRALGFRTFLAVPMRRESETIGVIVAWRAEPRPFTATQIELVKTFADQAVIAIENVRLFKQLEEKNRALTQAHTQVSEALEQQTATAEILRVIAGSPTDLQPVLDALVESAGRLCQATDTFLLLAEGDQLRVAALHGAVGEGARISNTIQRGWVAGRAVVDARTVHVEDLANAAAEFPLGAAIATRLGHRTALAIPLLGKGVPIGALFLRRREVRRFSDAETALLQTFADQAVIAIENVRLFKELEAANRELAAASQHKSEFLANMSHELRTPLNAIIGFSEVLSEKMFGELNEKQEEYSKDIHASGQHLLSLINDILDLSKIEAGRMELELTSFDLPTAIENALMLVRERAGRRNITLHTNVDARLGQIQADERKIRQVVLNLLSNAIKFTPEGGRIDISAVPRDGFVEVSVSDTGVGIEPEDQEAVFEEFRQVGPVEKKVEGTGLGLALSRKFIELHGGRIWVKSQVGEGSTFTFTVPVRCGE